MALKVIWSPQAEKSLDSLVGFLEDKWPAKVITTLLVEVDTTVTAIAKQPLMYPYLSDKKQIHKCVIKSKTLLLYKVLPNHIELLLFVDSRQNPAKYKF